jgi:hypothetical protein
VKWWDNSWRMNWKGRGRKRPWYSSGICLEVLRKSENNVSIYGVTDEIQTQLIPLASLGKNLGSIYRVSLLSRYAYRVEFARRNTRSSSGTWLLVSSIFRAIIYICESPGVIKMWRRLSETQNLGYDKSLHFVLTSYNNWKWRITSRGFKETNVLI